MVLQHGVVEVTYGEAKLLRVRLQERQTVLLLEVSSGVLLHLLKHPLGRVLSPDPFLRILLTRDLVVMPQGRNSSRHLRLVRSAAVLLRVHVVSQLLDLLRELEVGHLPRRLLSEHHRHQPVDFFQEVGVSGFPLVGLVPDRTHQIFAPDGLGLLECANIPATLVLHGLQLARHRRELVGKGRDLLNDDLPLKADQVVLLAPSLELLLLYFVERRRRQLGLDRLRAVLRRRVQLPVGADVSSHGVHELQRRRVLHVQLQAELPPQQRHGSGVLRRDIHQATAGVHAHTARRAAAKHMVGAHRQRDRHPAEQRDLHSAKAG
mmetsp:Transcript_3667/g.9357  ORF Transcript_3667/g.9357 Transcript_3667/m.9357 type:complete len:320 (-) Transcript_3667:48-1007(-)